MVVLWRMGSRGSKQTAEGLERAESRDDMAQGGTQKRGLGSDAATRRFLFFPFFPFNAA